ncbi:A24 family peptidase [Pusillimonas noertemannii]|uniref:A24 family peptidase n=1 Tax=Pusillimonas noertemannii TaxID=305977 RepID=UPI0002D4DE61|nr:A24 family peptidase [Pusillimonas noertemannii]
MLKHAWPCLFLAFNALVIAYDLRFRRVPNLLLAAALLLQTTWLLAAAPNVAAPMAASGWTQAGLGFAVGLALFYPLWRFGAMGAGDVKYIAVLGACVGTAGLFSALLPGSLLAGMHALAVTATGGLAGARANWRAGAGKRRGIPYAAYLALSAMASAAWLIVCPSSWLFSLIHMT